MENEARYNLPRLREINADATSIAVGCSITASYYLEEGFSWPRIIEQVTNEPINICAASGSSIMLQAQLVTDLLNYVQRPRTVYALFPDLERFIGPISAVPDRGSCLNYIWMPELMTYISTGDYPRLQEAKESADNGSKKRIRAASFLDFQNMNHLIPAEFGIFQSLMGLEIINNVCSLLNMQQHLFSWDVRTQQNLETMKIPHLITGGMRDNPLTLQGYDMQNLSCTRHSPTSAKQTRAWKTAHDGSHPGLHDHIHYAETFIGKEIKQIQVENLRP